MSVCSAGCRGRETAAPPCKLRGGPLLPGPPPQCPRGPGQERGCCQHAQVPVSARHQGSVPRRTRWGGPWSERKGTGKSPRAELAQASGREGATSRLEEAELWGGDGVSRPGAAIALHLGTQAWRPPAQRGKARRHGVEDLPILPEGRGRAPRIPAPAQTGGRPDSGYEAAPGRREPPKDTRRALRAAHEVEAGGDHVGHLPAAGQALAHGHLEEVEGRVQAVLVQLQLAPQVVDLPPP